MSTQAEADKADVAPPPYPGVGESNGTPPAYILPQHDYPRQPAYPQPAYPTQQGYPAQQGYPLQQGYPAQQPGCPQVAYNHQQGNVTMMAPSAAVIVRNPGIQPNDYMALALFVTVCCCLPFGLVGVMKASEVKNKWAMGDVAGAEASSKEAKRWSMFGLITGVVTVGVTTAIIVVYYTTIVSSIYSRGY